MHAIIRVEPLVGGWMVRPSDRAQAEVYASGARAEEAALRLAARLSEAGHSSEVVVYLRDGALAGRFVCGAAQTGAVASEVAA